MKDPYAGQDFGQVENSDGNTVHGTYFVALPDGRKQTVSLVLSWSIFNQTIYMHIFLSITLTITICFFLNNSVTSMKILTINLKIYELFYSDIRREPTENINENIINKYVKHIIIK